MKFLFRAASPAVLLDYDYRTHTWEKVPTKDKNKIWLELDKMQGERCAYCQAKVKKGSRHIEHFRQRRTHQDLTFQWTNLFGSCLRSDGCGVYKDKQKYLDADLIKFDEENPELYFQFTLTGRIKIRPNLSRGEIKRAEETLRVLNLNPNQSPLIYDRASAIKAQTHLSEAMITTMSAFIDDDEMGDCSDIFLEMLEEHLKSIEGFPFETAIKHHFISRFEDVLNVRRLP
ncbi:retron Ec78 anti-phage system effector HNH endonuclease PtuB [Serratia plymuthica]|uniref:retron Ec78 anti-phage system effector HNH endonuclease PtuB n=1 Tax=Serratia plymuthica TaxID=82996 RepID=UPI000EFE4719|nr:retron Ec78 anti-phage system effector HNH endonuclease PtuB [Serratia plymuthica]